MLACNFFFNKETSFGSFEIEKSLIGESFFLEQETFTNSIVFVSSSVTRPEYSLNFSQTFVRLPENHPIFAHSFDIES